MHDVGFGKPRGGAWIHPLPGHALALTAPSYEATPGAAYPVPDNPEPTPVARDAIVPRGPYAHTCEPGPALLDGPVPTRSPRLLDLLEWLAEPCGAGTAPHRTLAALGGATPGRPAEEVADLRLPWPTPLAPCACPPPTRHEARLLRVQCPGAPVASLPPGAEKRLGGVFGRDTAEASVPVPHDTALSPGVPAAPRRGPAGKDLVPGPVRQEPPGAAPWRRPCRLRSPGPLLPPARLAPLPAGAADALLPHPGLDPLPHPGVGQRLGQAPHVGIASPGAGVLCPPHRDRLHRLGRAAAGAGTVRAPETLCRVAGGEHRDRRPRDAVVLQRRRAAGPLAPRSCGEGDRRDRGRVVRSPRAPVRHVPPVGCARRAGGGPCLALQARGGLVLAALRRLPPSGAGVALRPQRGPPFLARLGCLPSPVQRRCPSCPARRPASGWLARVALGPFPALPDRRRRCLGWIVPPSAGGLGAGAALVLGHGPTPGVWASRACPWGAPCGPWGERPGQPPGLPRPAHQVPVHARGLRPRQGRVRLAHAACPLGPAAGSERVGTQDSPACGALYPAGPFPCHRCTVLVPEARA
jgi:hypothetical protein